MARFGLVTYLLHNDVTAFWFTRLLVFPALQCTHRIEARDQARYERV